MFNLSDIKKSVLTQRDLQAFAQTVELLDFEMVNEMDSSRRRFPSILVLSILVICLTLIGIYRQVSILNFVRR